MEYIIIDYSEILNFLKLYIYSVKGSVTVGYIFVYCLFISLFAKNQ